MLLLTIGRGIDPCPAAFFSQGIASSRDDARGGSSPCSRQAAARGSGPGCAALASSRLPALCFLAKAAPVAGINTKRPRPVPPGEGQKTRAGRGADAQPQAERPGDNEPGTSANGFYVFVDRLKRACGELVELPGYRKGLGGLPEGLSTGFAITYRRRPLVLT